MPNLIPNRARVAPQEPRRFRRDFSRCPRCGSATQPAMAMNQGPSQYFLECTNPICNTYINTYVPQAHQEAVHRDNHRIIGNFGAYGTGKTTTSREEIFKHLFLTANANVLVGANVQSQYEQTLKRELEADLPQAFILDYSAQKQYFDMVNGARVMYRPFDDEDKLRSYNLTMWVGLESSEIRPGAFHQLKTRLRNTNACTFQEEDGQQILDYDDRGVGVPRIAHDWRKGIAESNPDSGWIRTEILMVSDKITQHGSISEKYDRAGVEIDPSISTHIASTDVNRFLPPGFIEENSRNKPKWWIARFLFGSFTYTEGLVYPSAAQHIVPTFEIPKHWRRIIAFDYGLTDDAVYISCAIDEAHGLVYAYKEARTNNMNINELAEIYFGITKDIPSGGMLGPPIADPKSLPKRDYEKKSLGDLFLEKGINFKPGVISVDARIMRLNTYFESGRLKIMDCCDGLIRELKGYKFPDRTLDSKKNFDKPIDKDNHGINPLEWIVMELPENPRNIIQGVYNKYGRDASIDPQHTRIMPHALDDEPTLSYEDSAFGIAPISSVF